MSNANHYEILRVRPDASTDEVRKAYHRLARDHHPDRFVNPEEKKVAEQRFAAMTEAFNVLSNPQKRKDYEDTLRELSSGESQGQKEAKNYFRGGVNRLNEGNAKDAIRLFKAAIHLDPGQASYYAHYAKALEADQAFGEASRQWEEAVKREPYNAKLYRQAGQCLERAGMKIRARRMYESALQGEKNHTVVIEALKRLGSDDDKKEGRLGGFFKRT